MESVGAVVELVLLVDGESVGAIVELVEFEDEDGEAEG